MKPDRRAPARTQSTLERSLESLDKCVSALRGLKLPALGPDFTHLSSDTLHDALVSHRASSKYEVPDASSAKLRREASIQEVLLGDADGWVDFDPFHLPRNHARTFYRARAWLADLLRDFKPTYSVRFPSGESAVSAFGDVDIITKLNEETQWVVSPSLVGYCVNILLCNRALLKVVKDRYREKYGDVGQQTLAQLRLAWIKSTPGGSVHGLRYQMVRFMFRACVVLDRTARVTTVPKNNRKDRVISCETLWSMICQLSFAFDLRNTLKRRLGIDLDTLATLHRALIRTGKATIDMRRASDRNFHCVLTRLWPGKVGTILSDIRTGIFALKDGDSVEYHPLRMFAPMGCGCTFEVMTITLLAYTRVFDPGASVFGDDIIVDQCEASNVIEFLESVGWLINNEKSFVAGNFRESCGAFADLRAQKLLLSYDFVRPTCLSEVYTLTHKVLHLCYALPRGSRVREILMRCYAELLLILPRDSMRVMDGRALNPYLGLSDACFYVPDVVYRNTATQRSSEATRCISHHWQRPVYISMVHSIKQLSHTLPDVLTSAHVMAFLRRGNTYAPLNGKTKTVMIPSDMETGTAIHSVVLASVL